MAADRCRGCGGRFPAPRDNDSHPYMLAWAGCWAAYNLLLAREYQDPALFARCHRLTIDAYAVQHRGDAADRRAVRSVWLHFVSLDAAIGRARSHDAARVALREATARPFPTAARRHAGVRDHAGRRRGGGRRCARRSGGAMGAIRLCGVGAAARPGIRGLTAYSARATPIFRSSSWPASEVKAMRSIILWLIGIPLPIILLLALCTHHL